MGTQYLVADHRKRPAGSEAGDGAKRVKNLVEEQTSFVKRLLCEFGEHCSGDIGKKEPMVQRYSGIGTHAGQTFTCSNTALAHYMKTKPMDSNGFECLVRKGNSLQPMWYIHVNFWARGSKCERELFFAELRGVDELNETLAVVPLGHDDETIKAESGEHFCKFCTGILHPRLGTFQGCEGGLA